MSPHLFQSSLPDEESFVLIRANQSVWKSMDWGQGANTTARRRQRLGA